MSLFMSKYPDISVVDASIVVIAERHTTNVVATTDHQHFSAIRPLHIQRFTLVP